MNAYQAYMEKVALTRFMKEVSWTRGHGDIDAGVVGHDILRMHLPGVGQMGSMNVHTYAHGGKDFPTVGLSNIEASYQGMGLAKKLYGRAMREAYEGGAKHFGSDYNGSQSTHAERMWSSLKRKSPNAIKTVPALGNPGDVDPGTKKPLITEIVDLNKLYNGPKPKPSPAPADFLANPDRRRMRVIRNPETGNITKKLPIEPRKGLDGLQQKDENGKLMMRPMQQPIGPSNFAKSSL